MILTTGGERGIRTLDRVAPIPPFQGGAFDHSAISPFVYFVAKQAAIIADGWQLNKSKRSF
jgi:hypothetical protein